MSLKVKITLLFSASVALMLLLGIWLYSVDSSKNERLIISRYMENAREMIPAIVENNSKLRLKKLDALKLKELKALEGDTVHLKKLVFGSIGVVKKDGNYYLKIVYLDEPYFFYSAFQETFQEEGFIASLLLLFDLIVLLVIYLAVLKMLMPIRELSKKMERFAKGAYDIRMKEEGDEEVVLAAKSFNVMARSLQEAIEGRENLLKYIGHEIKTPLAKIKFAVENKDLGLIKKSSEEIDSFVGEILDMHMLTSGTLDKKRVKAETLLAEALGKVYIEDETKIEVVCDDCKIDADLHHMSTAVKNLIDNALKYTEKFPVTIVAKEHFIEVQSFGKKLDQPLSYYVEPFSKEHSEGYGLGLSIVDNIVKKHGFTLAYEYRNGKNVFVIRY